MASSQSLLAIFTVAVFRPVEAGAKVTVNVADPPGVIGDADVNIPGVNRPAALPVIEIAVMVKLADPVF